MNHYKTKDSLSMNILPLIDQHASIQVEATNITDDGSNYYGFRTRHLSCIEENESDSFNSLVSDILLESTDMLMSSEIDKTQWGSDHLQSMESMNEPVHFEVLQCISLDNLQRTQDGVSRLYDSGESHIQRTSSPYENPELNNYSDAMITSCYGSLTPSFKPEKLGHFNINGPCEPIYAVIDKEIQQKNQLRKVIDFARGTNSSKTLDPKVEVAFIQADNNDIERTHRENYAQNVCEDLKRLGSTENYRPFDVPVEETSCPSCNMQFNNDKRRKLIDSCGHERCYSCMFASEICPFCSQQEKFSGLQQRVSNQDTYPQDELIKSENVQSDMFQSYESFGYSSPEAAESSIVSAVEVLPIKNGPNIDSELSDSCRKLKEKNTPPSTQRKKNFTAKGLRRTFGGGHRRTSSQGSLEVPTSLSDCSVMESSFHSDSVITKTKKHTNSQNSPGRSNGVYFSRAAYAGHLSTYVFGKIKSLWSAQSNNAGLNQLADDVANEVDSAGKLNSVPAYIDTTVTKRTNGKASKKLNPNIFSQRLSTNLRSIKDWSARKNQPKSPPLTDSSERDDSQMETSYNSFQHELRFLALKPLFFEVPLQEPDPIFIGRQWILRDISNVITASDMPGVLITGDIGSGKTSLMLQFVDYSCFGRKKGSTPVEGSGIYCQINVSHERIKSLASQVVAYHFCQAENNRTCFVPDFVHSLAAQLCQAPQLTAYRECLLNDITLQDVLSINECLANPEQVMLKGILEPLAALKKAGRINVKQALLLVDALCEANTHQQDYGPTISSFLVKMVSHFPTWFKVVVTIRSQYINLVKGLPYMRFALDNWQSNENVQKDINEYISHRIKHNSNIARTLLCNENTNPNPGFLDHLSNLSKGSFLFVKQTLDLIEKELILIKSLKSLPSSLAQIFLIKMTNHFANMTNFDQVSNIFSVCLASLTPLTLSEIYYSLVALNSDEAFDWNDFLLRFKQLDDFMVKRIDNTYMFFHPSFREWLMHRENGEPTKFLVDFRKGHYAIAFRMSRLQAPLDAAQTIEFAHHILRARFYRCLQPIQSSLKDIQAYWIASVSSSVTTAMVALRNIYAPDVKVCRLLLLAGANPNFQTEFLHGSTILCIAAFEGMASIVRCLLEFGADASKSNNKGQTPLILASLRGHDDVVRLLVAAGSTLGQCSHTQRCALAYAASAGKGTVVKYLLTCDWNQLHVGNGEITFEEAVNQALIMAASYKHLDILEDLLDASNASVDAIDPETGNTALINAVCYGDLETVSFLLSRGAQIDKRNTKGQSALIFAVRNGYCNIAELLLEQNSRAEQTEVETEKTPLVIASEEGHLDIVKLLYEKGTNIDHKDINGLTALSWACLQSHYAVVKYLLEKGANLEATDHFKRTALDFASYQAPSRLIHLLIDKGANVKHVDENGVSPLDRAVACRNISVLQAFLKAGAIIGTTTWTLAEDSPDITLLLLNNVVKDGNSLLKRNILQEAAAIFRFALEKMSTLQETASNPIVVTQLLYNLLLCLARCKRKMNSPLEAIHLATRAIAIVPPRYEGYYVRAKAYFVTGNHEAALRDIDDALGKAINTSSFIKDVLVRTKLEIENKDVKFRLSCRESTDL